MEYHLIGHDCGPVFAKLIEKGLLIGLRKDVLILSITLDLELNFL